MRNLSRRDLEALGKSGPDVAPPVTLVAKRDPRGGTAMVPEGVGFGWDYMPGELWERDLVPSALPVALEPDKRLVIDQPRSLDELFAAARPFKGGELGPDELEDGIALFLKEFGINPGETAWHQDHVGNVVPVSDAFFTTRTGDDKSQKQGRGPFVPLFAETLREPDEIWLGASFKKSPHNPEYREWFLDLRYVRVGEVMRPDGTLRRLAQVVIYQMGNRTWDAVTAFIPSRGSKPAPSGVNARRNGRLLWPRKK